MLNLAAVYYQAGQRAQAIAIIQAMMAADPLFKQQGQAYIDQINAGQ